MWYLCAVSVLGFFERGERSAPTLQVQKVVWNAGVYFSFLVKALFQLRLMGLSEEHCRGVCYGRGLPSCLPRVGPERASPK